MAGVELCRREETEDRGAVGKIRRCGVGVSSSSLGSCPSRGHFFLILFLEIALFGALWGIFKSLYSYVCVPFSYPQRRFADLLWLEDDLIKCKLNKPITIRAQMKFMLVHGLDMMIKAG